VAIGKFKCLRTAANITEIQLKKICLLAQLKELQGDTTLYNAMTGLTTLRTRLASILSHFAIRTLWVHDFTRYLHAPVAAI
jgi:hypothetical protein